MKQIVLIISMMIFLNTLSSCETNQKSETENVPVTVEIVNSYINDLGNKVFVMSDGGMAEIIIRNPSQSERVVFYDKSYQYLSSEYRFSLKSTRTEESFRKWLNAEIGTQAFLEKSNGVYRYNIVIAPDFYKERKVTRVTKYDGNLNKIEGSMRLSGGILCGTSGSGSIKEEGMESKNMFINIYFADRDPICVNAKENQLWLDVEAGGIVIEKRINGKTLFMPKF